MFVLCSLGEIVSCRVGNDGSSPLVEMFELFSSIVGNGEREEGLLDKRRRRRNPSLLLVAVADIVVATVEMELLSIEDELAPCFRPELLLL